MRIGHSVSSGLLKSLALPPLLRGTFCLTALLALNGCGGGGAPAVPKPDGPGLSFSGRAMDGQQPITGAHVYLFAAGTSGYGTASVPLLTSVGTGYADSAGGYVLTASDGTFSIPGGYTCKSTDQLYVYLLGGNTGFGANSAIGEMAVVGGCPLTELAVPPFVWVNEVSTIAAAYAMAGFATDATHVSSSGTVPALIGVANAFANAANLVSPSTGTVLSVTPAGNGKVPQATLNTVANVLSACIRSPSSASQPCQTLFINEQNGGSRPNDTATAAFRIAHSPSFGVGILYALQTTASPFAPALVTTPNDYTIGINITGGGINYPKSLAVDGSGDVWIASENSSGITELSASGAFLSGPSGYPAGLDGPFGVAIDLVGSAWVTNYSSVLGAQGDVVELSSSGSLMSGAGYTGGGLQGPLSIAIDGSGSAWMTDYSPSITELSISGKPVSGTGGYTGGGLRSQAACIAIDASGSAWIANANGIGVVKLSNFGAVESGANGFIGAGAGGLGIAIDGTGSAWVAEGSSIAKFSNAGSLLSGTKGFVGGGVEDVYNLAIDGAGNA
jgi:hypothetical protein